MKFTKAIFVGAFALSLFACSGSGDYLPLDDNNNTSAQTYMTINLAGSTSSRTVGDETEAGVDPNENKIASLAIALVNTADNSVDLFTSPVLNPTSETAVSVAPFLIRKGTYRILLVANPTQAAITALNNANNYASLQLALNEINTFANNNSFMMTNAVNYKGDVTNIPTVTVTADNIASNPAHPQNAIQLDRMAVKIRMSSAMTAADKSYKINGGAVALRKYVDGKLTTVSYNKVVMKSYALLNTYKHANLYQSWSATSATNNQLLVTPNSNKDYATADFNNIMDTYSTRTKSASYTSGYSSLVDLTHNIALTSLTSASYCLENNSKTSTQISSAVNANVYYTKQQSTTTGVLFRAQLLDGNDKGLTFYSYNGRLYADLASIQADYTNVFAGKAVSEVEKMSVENIRTSYGVKVYQDGYMYYTHYIYDQNYTDPAAVAAGASNNRYYAVLRNSIYEMNVTGIRRVGDDIPGGWDYTGEDDIDKKDATLQIELTVSPWVLDFYSAILK